ncbi:hypothetical protein SynA1825c_01817 [Synechococcus sp. A18-25c]|nr:hypothetical protein SynA1825c_01817 [Synechococcus sp. A18-25c]
MRLYVSTKYRVTILRAKGWAPSSQSAQGEVILNEFSTAVAR